MYLDMMENWLMPQLADEEEQAFIFQHDGALYIGIWTFGGISIETCQVNGLVMQRTQITPSVHGHPVHRFSQCDFFLWGYIIAEIEMVHY